MTADQQQHRDQAIRDIARYLQPRLVAGLDPAQTAAIIITNLTHDHWKCIPPPPAITAATPHPGQVETNARGAQQARQALGLDRP
jgi:hypothetical protein